MNIKIEYLKPGMSFRFYDKPLTEEDIDSLKKEKLKTVDIEIVDRYNHLQPIVVDYLVYVFNELSLDERISCINTYIDSLEHNKVLPDYNVYLEDYDPIKNYVYTSVILSNLIKSYNKMNIKDISFSNTLFSYFFKEIGREAKDHRVLEKIRTYSTRTFYNLHEDFPIIDEDLLDHYNPDYYFIYSYLMMNRKGVDSKILDTILFSFEKESSNLGPLNCSISSIDDNELANRLRVIRAAELYDFFLYASMDETDIPFENVERNLEKAISQNILNPYIVNIMTSSMPIYNVGDKVRLSDNTIGVVSSINRKDLIHPVIVDLNGNHIDLRNDIYIKNIEYKD